MDLNIKNIVLNAGNSGTFARLILGLLIKSPYYIKLIGDKSLSQRDFDRVIKPLQEVGASFKVNRKEVFTNHGSTLQIPFAILKQ